MDSNSPLSVRTGEYGCFEWSRGGGEWQRWRMGEIPAHLLRAPMNQSQTEAYAEALGRIDDKGRPHLGDYTTILDVAFKPRINIRSQTIELNGTPLKEEQFEHFHGLCVKEHSWNFRKADLQSALRYVASLREYDPVEEELNSFACEACDVLTDEEWAQLAQLCFGLEGEFEGEVLRKWLISAVARVYKPGCKVDQALILYGPQGQKKSTFFRTIGGEYFSDSLGDLSKGKDDLQVLHRCWIAEWGEVDRVFAGAQKAEEVKRFVSAQRDDFRPPYGRNVRSHDRRSVIVGSTNRDDWATDPTGNRRYPILSAKGINGGWIEDNRARILGRAVAEFRKGAQWWYDAEGEAEISRRASEFAPEDPDKEQIFEFLKANPGQAFNGKELWMIALARPIELWDLKNARRVARAAQSLIARNARSERRWHLPSKASCGGGSETNVWWLPPSN
jgi:predicted P-loop ATPase